MLLIFALTGISVSLILLGMALDLFIVGSRALESGLLILIIKNDGSGKFTDVTENELRVTRWNGDRLYGGHGQRFDDDY